MIALHVPIKPFRGILYSSNEESSLFWVTIAIAKVRV
jgi:hypothetical protein